MQQSKSWLTIISLFLIINHSYSRLLATDEEDKFYSHNIISCNKPFIQLLLGDNKKTADTEATKKVCKDIRASCCSKPDIDSGIKQMEHAKNILREQLKFINEFLDKISALDPDKIISFVPIPEGSDEQAKESEVRTFKNLFLTDLKASKQLLEGYFNTVVMNYSGLICQVCDDRFGEFFFKDADTLVVSPSQCSNSLQNQSKFFVLASQLELLLKLANSFDTVKENAINADQFSEQFKGTISIYKKCGDSDLADDDESEEKEDLSQPIKNENSLQTDNGTEGDEDSFKDKDCEAACRSQLPFAPFKLPFDPYPAIQYLQKAFKAKFPELNLTPGELPYIEPVTFFNTVVNMDEGKPLSLSPTALNFYGFPVDKKNYQIVEISEVHETSMSVDDIVPNRQLPLMKRIFNAMFGWLFGRFID